MNAQDESAAPDEAGQTAPQGEVEQSSIAKATEDKTETQQTSLADALLATAKAEGHDIGDVELPKAQAPEEETEPEGDKPAPAEGKDAEEEEESEEGETDEAELKPAATEHKSIEDQIAAAEAKGEKPPWYLKRIVEEADKKRRASERAEKAEAVAAQLHAQLVQATAPKPTEENPLIDVTSEAELDRLAKSYKVVWEMAERNRDGPWEEIGEDKDGNPILGKTLPIGTDAEGKEVTKAFTREQIIEMRIKSDRAIRDDIPARRDFLAARAKADAIAAEIYPQVTPDAKEVLKANPKLEAVLGPEVLVWIDFALTERNRYLSKNGQTSADSDSTAKIVKAAKTKIAPTPPKTRSFAERRRGADLAQLEKRMEERGDQESVREYLEALDAQKRSAGKLERIAE